MSKESSRKLRPSDLRIILIIATVLLVVAIGAGVVLGMNHMNKIADETNLLARKAKASENNISQMEDLKKRYESVNSIQPIIDKMVASQVLYRYQDNAIDTLYKYAQLSGISIAQYSFAVPKGTAPVAASGSKNILISINLDSPIAYENFIQFMRRVEGGLSQMQILQVDVRKETRKKDTIGVGSMVIAIYVK